MVILASHSLLASPSTTGEMFKACRSWTVLSEECPPRARYGANPFSPTPSGGGLYLDMNELEQHPCDGPYDDVYVELEDVLLRIEEIRNSGGDPQEIADLVDYAIQLGP